MQKRKKNFNNLKYQIIIKLNIKKESRKINKI